MAGSSLNAEPVMSSPTDHGPWISMATLPVLKEVCMLSYALAKSIFMDEVS